MSAALALPTPVRAAPAIHILAIVSPGTARAMKRANARQMPSRCLRADVQASRSMILGPHYSGPYSGAGLIARLALNAARARAALAMRGEPVRALNLSYCEPESAS